MKIKRLASFTLMEMLMVLVILGIILALATPKWSNYLSFWDLDNEAARIAAKIREVQQKAIFGQETWRLVFDLTADNYRIERCAWGSCLTDSTVSIQGEDVDLGSTTLPYIDDASTIPPGYVLAYDKFGATSFSVDQAQITLSARDSSRSKIIYINNVTGTVSIKAD